MHHGFNNKIIKVMGTYLKFQKYQQSICLFLILEFINLHVRRIPIL